MSKKKSAPIASYFALGFLTTLCLGVSLVNINIFLDKQKVLGVSAQTIPVVSQAQLKQERDFWLNIINQNPTYRDGYVELADIEKQLGNGDSAMKMLEIAKSIDPNSENLSILEVSLALE